MKVSLGCYAQFIGCFSSTIIECKSTDKYHSNLSFFHGLQVLYVAPSGKRLRSMVEIQRCVCSFQCPSHFHRVMSVQYQHNLLTSYFSLWVVFCFKISMNGSPVFHFISLVFFLLMLRYLLQHPEYMEAGVTMSQFSFQTPKPLQENYVRKRAPARLTTPVNGGSNMVRMLPGFLQPSDGM